MAKWSNEALGSVSASDLLLVTQYLLSKEPSEKRGEAILLWRLRQLNEKLKYLTNPEGPNDA